ncbi:hypothetical protein CFC21_002291 [Triticum aestivum]|uniref:Uncharacterized protein n=1 Tax=Triticum aestivum TaxID=4565 RepID=A0A3B5Y0L0_WHEAT|nr:hypothetical protein CFC21_002291 [Triticum aestivum]
MLKNILSQSWRRGAHVLREGHPAEAMYACSSQFHSGQVLRSVRSFFGVEDFMDEDNSKPYTYKKEKRSKNPHKHISFKQRTIAHMEPFTLDVFISKRFVSASLTHRSTCRQVAVAGTNSKDVKAALTSRSDVPAWRACRWGGSWRSGPRRRTCTRAPTRPGSGTGSRARSGPSCSRSSTTASTSSSTSTDPFSFFCWCVSVAALLSTPAAEEECWLG